MENNLNLLDGLYARVKISPFDNQGDWILLEDFTYHIGYKGSPETITVSRGFVFNGMSIPRIFWWFASPMDSSTIIASLLHDWLFAQQMHSLSRTDEIFHEVLVACGNSRFKAGILFLGLRIGSWHKWNLIQKSKEI